MLHSVQTKGIPHHHSLYRLEYIEKSIQSEAINDATSSFPLKMISRDLHSFTKFKKSDFCLFLAVFEAAFAACVTALGFARLNKFWKAFANSSAVILTAELGLTVDRPLNEQWKLISMDLKCSVGPNWARIHYSSQISLSGVGSLNEENWPLCGASDFGKPPPPKSSQTPPKVFSSMSVSNGHVPHRHLD